MNKKMVVLLLIITQISHKDMPVCTIQHNSKNHIDQNHIDKNHIDKNHIDQNYIDQKEIMPDHLGCCDSK